MTNLIEQEGNLITMLENDEVDVVVHQTNCFKTLGEGVSSGIARALGDTYNEVMQADLQYTKGDINQLGQIMIVPITTKSGLKKYIVNCYSQYNYGLVNDTSPTSYLAMQTALTTLNQEIHNSGAKGLRFATYQLGCNRGGADWNVVSSILKNTLTTLDRLLIVEKK